MPFMLLGKGPEDDIWLLCHSLMASRREALDELSRITADPGFTDWDAEVFVLDLDQAAPVLLVRPGVAQSAEPETEHTVETATQEHGAVSLRAGTATVGDKDSVSSDEPQAAGTAADYADADLTAVLLGLTEEEEFALGEERELPEAHVEVLHASEFVDATWADAVADSGSEPPETLPPDMTLQATEDVEASVVRAPMSVRDYVPASLEGLADAEDDVMTSDESAVAELELETPPAGSWPWSLGVEAQDDLSIPLDLEEATAPQLEMNQDDLTGDVVTEDAVAQDSIEHDLLAERVAAEAPAVAEQAPEDESTTTEVPEVDSDFVNLEEEPVDETPPAPEPPGYQRDNTGGDFAMTCNDCIYVETCPHAGERDPASCGSFQWR
jgi:hypothetical protein